jgi:hypothetical protein
MANVDDFQLRFTNGIHANAVDLNRIDPIAHTIEMNVGESWHQWRDMHLLPSAFGSIEFVSPTTFRTRRRLIPLMRRRRSRRWLLRRKWLVISPPAHMRIDFPQVQFNNEAGGGDVG